MHQVGKKNYHYIRSMFVASSIQCACAVLYCHLRPVWLWHTFPHHLLIDTIFRIKLLNTKCVFRISLQLLSEAILILRRSERDTNINIDMSSYKVLVILGRFSKNVQIPCFTKTRTIAAGFFSIRTDWQDRHDESSIRSLQFCERVSKL